MTEFLLALDAGHCRHTPGRRIPAALDGNQTREWVLNDRVCRYLQARAKAYEGFGVLRVDDVTGEQDVTLKERCAAANGAGANLFLSIHHNAYQGDPWDGGGVVAFCARGSGLGAPWRDLLYDAVVAAGGLSGNRSEPKAEMNYDVLVGTDMAAVLLECGFMDSRADAPVILRESYARAIGFAMADAIAKKAGLSPVENGRYRRLEEIPAYAAATVQKLLQKDILLGKGGEAGLDLSEDMVRLLVLLDRAGTFG